MKTMQWTEHVPSDFICQNPNPQCGNIRRCGLWEVTRAWGSALMNGISALLKRDLKACRLTLLSAMWRHKEKATTCRICGHLNLGFWASRICEVNVCFLKLPSLRHSVITAWSKHTAYEKLWDADKEIFGGKCIA